MALLMFAEQFLEPFAIFQWLKTPLHPATENEQLDIAKYLIEHGALVNAKNEVR